MGNYFTARTYPILGNNDTTQNLFTIENGIASRVDINVRRLLVQNDAIIASTVVMPIVKTCRASNISGGYILDRSEFDTTLTSSESGIVVRSGMYESGRIFATAGDTVWQQYTNRQHTAVEQSASWDNNLLPMLVSDTGKEFKLKPGESILVRVIGSTVAVNNALANNWFVEAVWEEVPMSTFNINGVVTLGGSPVVGAKVIIISSRDKQMTDASLREIVTTGAGGVWSSSIRKGWVGSAFVQYENGGTLYTASGSPFLES